MSEGGSNVSPAGVCCSRQPEGRVSIARWTLKGLRSTGPRSRGLPHDESVGQRRARLSRQYGGEGVPTHPSHQGVCEWHGTEDLGVTPGGLAVFRVASGKRTL